MQKKSLWVAATMAGLFSLEVIAAEATLNSVPDPDSRALLQMPAAAKKYPAD
jgi:hypothetical protein